LLWKTAAPSTGAGGFRDEHAVMTTSAAERQAHVMYFSDRFFLFKASFAPKFSLSRMKQVRRRDVKSGEEE
jgi:hypothetical protein